MNEVMSNWPEWLGSPVQLGIWLTLLIAVLRYGPAWKSQSFTEAETLCKTLQGEITELRSRLEICERTHKTAAAESAAAIAKLKDDLLGEKANRVQEQISLISVMLRGNESPELIRLMHTLEAVQIALRPEGPNVLQTQDGNVLQKDD